MELPIFPGVKNPEDEHVAVPQLVSEFVVSNQYPADLPRLKLGQTNTEPRVGRNPLCTGYQLTDDLS